jgi:4,5-dihydroxyphthalate decarboxylase
VYLRADSPIRTPADLKGKRIGVGDYQMTAAVWVKGFLQHEYGVRPQDVTWVTGSSVRRMAPPAGIQVEPAPAGASLETLLERGDIDALISVMLPRALGTGVKRLFADFRQVETEYYRKTRIFPIMHTLVLKREIYEAEPWLAISFYKAFCRARDMAYHWLYDTDALPVALPWIIDEIETTRRLFGPKIWDYSVEGSRPTLEALVAYLHEQGLTRGQMAVDGLFVPNIRPDMAQYLHATGED